MFNTNPLSRRSVLTGWADNPWVLGAYANATPGHYGARADLAKPLAERLFLAGEAVAGSYKMLCHGAYMSGEVVAAVYEDHRFARERNEDTPETWFRREIIELA
jgi:monoamine oxidase